MYLNKALVIGNLTRDPELKSLPSGTAVCNFSLATNRNYTDSDGNKKEDTNFHNIVVFGRQAETTSQYLSKGSMALVEGRIQTRSWEGDDGKRNYRTEIVANRVQFGPRNGSNDGNYNNSGSSNKNNKNNADQEIDYPEDEDITPEDIPF
ncbi:MAG: single-stranded DNA-binding protein [Candidatus Paceibacterota bacterium]